MPIRARLAGLFALGALVLVAVGGAIFLHLLGAALQRSTDRSLSAAASPVVQTVADTGPGTPDLPDTAPAVPGEIVTQVLSPRGQIVGSPSRALGNPLLPRDALARARSRRTTLTTGRLRLLAVPVRRTDGTWLVIAADSIAPRAQALARVRTGLTVAAGLVVVLGTVGAWLLAGGALGPVERMRRSASDIQAHDPGGRVAVPGTHDELAALARTFNGLLDRLQAALAAQRRLVADAGHELRGPLAILRTELELADRPGRSHTELVDAVRLAATESDRLSRLADDLLFLARSDEGALLVTAVDQPLRPVLADAMTGRQRQADDGAVRLRLTVGPAVHCPIDADRGRHAVDNLLDNALRLTPPGGTIAVSARRTAAEVVIEVTDDGPGFPAAFLPLAFERFRRPDDARSDTTGGSGLGLAIVQAVALAHGGRATVANRDPTGAVVTLRLPP
ncbi:MAG: sensor histidine kinase [Mycobacteriales bacterium]